MRRLALSYLTIILILAAPLTALADPANDEIEIRERLHQWRTAFNARDVQGACDLFAHDLKYAVPGHTHGTYRTMCGNFEKLFAKPGLKFTYAKPDIHEILISGDLGIVRLTWTLTTDADGDQEASVEEGIDVFRRQADGKWSITKFIAF
ncbi:MAG: nuclear transport factor 2 family protein [Mesorhizobium sp.]